MFGNLRWRIAVPFLLLSLAAAGASTAYTARLTRDRSLHDLQSQLHTQALFLSQAASEYLGDTPDRPRLESLAATASGAGGPTVAIVAQSGLLVVGVERDAIADLLAAPDVKDALSGRPSRQVLPDPASGVTTQYVSLPVERDGRILGAVRVGMSVAAIDSTTRRIALVGGLTGGAAALISLLLALWISAVTTRPIKRIAHMAVRIAHGQSGQRAYGKFTDEIGQLARAFNQMAASLESTTRESLQVQDTISAVLSTMADAFLTTNKEGVITLANPAAERLFTMPASEITGRPFIEVVRDYEVAQILERCLSSRGQETGEVDLGAGKKRLRVVATPLAHEGGTSALVMIQDLTELRRLEGVRRDFVANVSHELRTPLASIKAAVETLEGGAIQDPQASRDFLRRIDIEVNELADIVQRLLELSRLETGRSEFALRPLDINPLVETVVERLRPQAEKKRLEVQTELPQGLPMVMADPRALSTVLINLLDNAIKFTPAGGKVALCVRPQGDSVLVEVRDSGVGIHPDDLLHIFERFYKADKSRSTPGVGLGLSLAKHIVQAHGGRIWADSELGHGSTFYFTLLASPGQPQR